MTLHISETVFSPWLTPVRLVSTANIAGTYYNGPNNNGVDATFTIAATSLTIDSVLVKLGDRILLKTQTNVWEQGIYVVEFIGTYITLQRAFDQQNIEQLKPGEFVAVGAGTVYAGSIYTLVEPIPQVIGTDAFIYDSYETGGEVILPTVANDLAAFNDVNGTLKDSGITIASIAALLAGSGGASGVRSASIAVPGTTATTVITDNAITAASVVIARFVSSANVVTVQTVLPAAGQVTVVTDTAPSTSVIEYISFTPSAALLTAGVVVGKGSYGGGSATFVIADANITAGMVVTTNFQSQVTPSKVYTATCGAGTITFVCSANPGVCVIEYAAMLPGNITPLGLHSANYSYAGGFASIAITDASITAQSIVTAEFKSQSVTALIQKVTPSAGLLTVLASIDPGPSVVAYIATATSGGSGSGTLPSGQIFVGNASNAPAPVAMSGAATISNTGVVSLTPTYLNYVAVPITAAQFNGMYAAPVQLVAAGGANTLIVVKQIQLLMTYGSAAFAAGGVAAAQWDSTANGAGVIATTTLSAATFTPTASTGFNFNSGVVPETFTTCVNKGIFLSNVTQAFTTGTGSSFVAHVWYSVIPTV